MNAKWLIPIAFLACFCAGSPASAEGSEEPVTGKNVTSVTFGDGSIEHGRFVQVGAKNWNRVDQDQTVVSFQETNRDEWSVHLSETSGNSNVVLNLWLKDVTADSAPWAKVMSAESLAYIDSRPQTAAPSSPSVGRAGVRANGYDAKQVSYGAGDTRLGAFVQTTAKLWQELNSEGVSFDFEETNRDEWTIYLRDASRDVTIRLDLHRLKVIYSDAQTSRDQYDILSAVSAVTGTEFLTEPTEVFQVVERLPPSAEEIAAVEDVVFADIPDMPQSDINAVMMWIKVKLTGNLLPFCWRQSYGRGVGKIPGRWADCPATYTNNGANCGRGTDDISAPSLLPDCPAGYTNNGLVGCGRGTDDIYSPSRLGVCPAGYTNMGLYCGKGWFGTAGLTCGAGYFKGPFERCYKVCPEGYTNTGDYCHRGVSTLGPSAFTCPAGYFKSDLTQRCHKTCPSAEYTNTGETCHKPISSLGIGSMFCNADEYRVGARCFFNDNDGCGTGNEDDTGLCYPKCNDAYHGEGPVCWQNCPSDWEGCGAGCAKTAMECGTTFADQVMSPLILAANAATLGLATPVTGAARAGATSVKIGGKVFTSSTKTGTALLKLADASSAAKAAASAVARAGSKPLQTVSPNMVNKNAGVVKRIFASRTGIGTVHKSSTATGATKAVYKLKELSKPVTFAITTNLKLYSAVSNYQDAYAEDFASLTTPEINREIDDHFHEDTARFLKASWGDIRLKEMAAAEADSSVFGGIQTALSLVSIVDITGVMGVASAFTKPICKDVRPFPELSREYK